MRSKYADYFNHDPDASDYDQDVAQESHPIRKGYQAALRWVGEHVLPSDHVLDLGSGTGNTILQIPKECPVTAVDVSAEMTRIAKSKLHDRNVDFVTEDVLRYIDGYTIADFDTIISTYAFHHLPPDERQWLFSAVRAKTKPRVRLLIADLMYSNDSDRVRLVEYYRSTFPEVADDFSDEFFWNIEQSRTMLESLGWNNRWKQISELTWVVQMERVMISPDEIKKL